MRYFIMSNSNTKEHTPVVITKEGCFDKVKPMEADWPALFDTEENARSAANEIPLCRQCGYTIYEWDY